MNSYAHLNELVKSDLESLPFMDAEWLEIPTPPPVAIDNSETNLKGADVSRPKRCRTIRELLLTEQKLEYSKSALFEMFDVLDVMNHSFRINKHPDTDYVKLNISRISEIAVKLLEEYGIAEIDVLNKRFDDRKAEVLASIKPHEFVSEGEQSYQSGQVVIVHQRGFVDVHSGELIRKAKVTVIE